MLLNNRALGEKFGADLVVVTVVEPYTNNLIPLATTWNSATLYQVNSALESAAQKIMEKAKKKLAPIRQSSLHLRGRAPCRKDSPSCPARNGRIVYGATGSRRRCRLAAWRRQFKHCAACEDSCADSALKPVFKKGRRNLLLKVCVQVKNTLDSQGVFYLAGRKSAVAKTFCAISC